ncbi:MAG: hypothetical protein PHS37_08150, partial [Candidatus Omnitrophica bacterium]|nr:hypothetical protein [Candidatus Omnitrophota bacterium]
MVVSIPGLLKNTGQIGHVGLGRANGLPVAYMDSGYFFNQGEIEKAVRGGYDNRKLAIVHEMDEIRQYESKRRFLQEMWRHDISYDRLRELVNEDPAMAERFHERSIGVEGLYDAIRRDTEALDWEALYAAYCKHGLAEDHPHDVNIAAAEGGKVNSCDEMLALVDNLKAFRPDKPKIMDLAVETVRACVEREKTVKDKLAMVTEISGYLATIKEELRGVVVSNDETARTVINLIKLLGALGRADERQKACELFVLVIRNRQDPWVGSDLLRVVNNVSHEEVTAWLDLATFLVRSRSYAEILWDCGRIFNDVKDMPPDERAKRVHDLGVLYERLVGELTGHGIAPVHAVTCTQYKGERGFSFEERQALLSMACRLAGQGIDPTGACIDAGIFIDKVVPADRIPLIVRIGNYYEEYYRAPHHEKPDNHTVVDWIRSRFMTARDYEEFFKSEIEVAGSGRSYEACKVNGSATRAWRTMNEILSNPAKESINVMMTYRCPFNCAFCYAKEACRTGKARDADKKMLYSVFDQLEGFEKAYLVGTGEVLCYGKDRAKLLEGGVSEDFLDVVRYAASKVNDVYIVTNAYLVPDDLSAARAFFQQFPPNVRWVVSVDDAHEKEFERVTGKSLVTVVKVIEGIRQSWNVTGERRLETEYNVRLADTHPHNVGLELERYGLRFRYEHGQGIHVNHILAQGNALINIEGAKEVSGTDIFEHSAAPNKLFPFIDPEGNFVSSDHIAYMSPDERLEFEKGQQREHMPQVIGNIKENPLARLVMEELLLRRFKRAGYKYNFSHIRGEPGYQRMQGDDRWVLDRMNVLPSEDYFVKAVSAYALGDEKTARTYMDAVSSGESGVIRWDIIDALYFLYVSLHSVDIRGFIEGYLDRDIFKPFADTYGMGLKQAFRTLATDGGERAAIESASRLNYWSDWNGFPRDWITQGDGTGVRYPVYPISCADKYHPFIVYKNFARDADFESLQVLGYRFILKRLTRGRADPDLFDPYDGLVPRRFGVIHDELSDCYYAMVEDIEPLTSIKRAALTGMFTLPQYKDDAISSLSRHAGSLGAFAATLEKMGVRIDDKAGGLGQGEWIRMRNDATWVVTDAKYLSRDTAMSAPKDTLLELFHYLASIARIQPFPYAAHDAIDTAFKKGYEKEMSARPDVRNAPAPGPGTRDVFMRPVTSLQGEWLLRRLEIVINSVFHEGLHMAADLFRGELKLSRYKMKANPISLYGIFVTLAAPVGTILIPLAAIAVNVTAMLMAGYPVQSFKAFAAVVFGGYFVARFAKNVIMAGYVGITEHRQEICGAPPVLVVFLGGLFAVSSLFIISVFGYELLQVWPAFFVVTMFVSTSMGINFMQWGFYNLFSETPSVDGRRAVSGFIQYRYAKEIRRLAIALDKGLVDMIEGCEKDFSDTTAALLASVYDAEDRGEIYERWAKYFTPEQLEQMKRFVDNMEHAGNDPVARRLCELLGRYKAREYLIKVIVEGRGEEFFEQTITGNKNPHMADEQKPYYDLACGFLPERCLKELLGNREYVFVDKSPYVVAYLDEMRKLLAGSKKVRILERDLFSIDDIEPESLGTLRFGNLTEDVDVANLPYARYLTWMSPGGEIIVDYFDHEKDDNGTSPLDGCHRAAVNGFKQAIDATGANDWRYTWGYFSDDGIFHENEPGPHVDGVTYSTVHVFTRKDAPLDEKMALEKEIEDLSAVLADKNGDELFSAMGVLSEKMGEAIRFFPYYSGKDEDFAGIDESGAAALAGLMQALTGAVVALSACGIRNRGSMPRQMQSEWTIFDPTNNNNVLGRAASDVCMAVESLNKIIQR